MPNSAPPPGTWIDIASKAIITVGFPTVMAGVLLWWLLTTLEKTMDAASARIATNTEAISRLITNEEAILKELQGQRQEMAVQTQYLKELMEKSGRLLQIQEKRQ